MPRLRTRVGQSHAGRAVLCQDSSAMVSSQETIDDFWQIKRCGKTDDKGYKIGHPFTWYHVMYDNVWWCTIHPYIYPYISIHFHTLSDVVPVLPSHWPTWEEVEVAAVASLQGVPALESGRSVDPRHYWTMGFNYMGVSENSVPLNPMVNDHYPY